MSDKLTIYGNFVVKYQFNPHRHTKEAFFEKKRLIYRRMETLLKSLKNDLKIDAIKMTSSYHIADPERGKYYYKIELKYPSLIGDKELIGVNNE